jgi:hypothetical protein
MLTPADELETCIGPPNVKGADDAPFTMDEWVHPPGFFPAYHDQIAARCEAKCWHNNQDVPDEMGGWIENEYGACMHAGEGPGHDDAKALAGYAEYSASDCGESTCPFYLASFSASNHVDAWTVVVTLPGAFSEEKHIENVQIDALQSVLGAWRPSTGQVAFLPGSLVFGTSFDVSSDCTDCTGLGDGNYELVLSNHEVVFGRFFAGGFVLEQTFPVVSGEATLEVDLKVEEGPPHASIALSVREECNDARGYVLGSEDSDSVDPDDDIESEMWIVEGVAVPNGTALEPGTYELALGVVDSRGAWDFADEQEVEVIHGRACI